MAKKRAFWRSGVFSSMLSAALIGAAAFVALYALTPWNPYLVWLTAWSATTLGFYGWDKWRAQHGGWRTPEKALHLLALAGGFPGGWAGMLLFRHKTRHGSFWTVLALATAIHGALAYYWFA